MNRLLACAGSLYLLSATMVTAADIPMPTATPEWSWQHRLRDYDWTGPYVGINGGGTLGVSSQSQTLAPLSSTGNFDLRGGLVGGTAGFYIQLDRTVFGLDGDLDWANSRGSTTCRAGAFVCSTSTSYLATVRPLVGFAFQYNFLAYVTGGVAFGDMKQSFSPTLAGNNGTISERVGWTAGAGFQYALWNPRSSNWSIKFEYLYVDLGAFNCTIACSGINGQITNITLRENVFRTGINYRY
jgi:outer membrane immunogenic protein